MKHLKTLTTAAIVGLVATCAFAQPQDRPGAGERRQRLAEKFGGADREQGTSQALNILTKQLELNEMQRAKISGILAETREGLKGQGKEMRSLLVEAHDKIAAELTPEQKPKLDKMKERMAQAAAKFREERGPELKERLQKGQGRPDGDRGPRPDMAPPKEPENRLLGALQELDNVTPEQKEQLAKIGKEMRDKTEALRAEMRPKMEALQRESRGQLRNVLTEDQLKQLHDKLGGKPGEAPASKGPDAAANPAKWREMRQQRQDRQERHDRIRQSAGDSATTATGGQLDF